MKKFEAPEMEVINICVADVITASVDDENKDESGEIFD